MRSELEGGADVDSLAIAAVVLERRQTLAVDAVADSAGDGDVAGQRISTADVDRIIVRLAKRGQSAPVASFGTGNDAPGKALDRITDADRRALASAKRRDAVLRLGNVARDGEPPPADRDAEIVAGRSENAGRRLQRGGVGGARRVGPGANRDSDL